MRLDLSIASQAKLEDIIESLYNKYDLEDLSPEELIDALLDMGIDLIVNEPMVPSVMRDKLISICARKVAMRG